MFFLFYVEYAGSGGIFEVGLLVGVGFGWVGVGIGVGLGWCK